MQYFMQEKDDEDGDMEEISEQVFVGVVIAGGKVSGPYVSDPSAPFFIVTYEPMK